MKIKLMSILLLNIAVHANIMTFVPENGSIEIVAKGRPALISIKAKGEGAKGVISYLEKTISGEVEFELNSLNSGIELRDEHMKETYLEVSKFPKAKLVLEKQEIAKVDESFNFKASLSLHGITKNISGIGKIIDDEVEANFELSLSDFGIKVPSHLGITVDDKIKIIVSSKLSK